MAAQLIERVRESTGFLESEDVEKQRDALFAFCKSITADAASREIVIQAAPAGLAQNQTPSGLATELCISNLPDQATLIAAQRAMAIVMPVWRFHAA